MNYLTLKKKYIGLDLFRVVCVAVVCAFHTLIHLNANYGIFSSVIGMGAIYMSAFFMLSGFTLFTNYASQNIILKDNLKLFLLRRIIGIIPMYYIAAILYVIFTIMINFSTIHDTIIQNLWLAPIEALCIQSNFSSLFAFTHNGGTWFISCIMLCYIIYPLIQEIIKQLSLRSKIIIIISCSSILLYSPIIVHKFGIASIYSNPFFRIIEFIIGITLASLKIELDNTSFIKKYVFNWFSIILVNTIMMISITIAVSLNVAVGDYMLYSWIYLPCFIFILFGLSGIESKLLSKSKLLSYFSNISYVFFLSQLFSNSISNLFITKYNITNNIVIIILGWGICIILAIGFHELLEKPISKRLKKRFLY